MLRVINNSLRSIGRRFAHQDCNAIPYFEEYAKIRPPPDFFYRKLEMQQLEEILKENMIVVLSGPRNCGKSRLMNEFFRDWSKYTTIEHDFRVGWSNDAIVEGLAKTVNDHLLRLSICNEKIERYLGSLNLS